MLLSSILLIITVLTYYHLILQIRTNPSYLVFVKGIVILITHILFLYIGYTTFATIVITIQCVEFAMRVKDAYIFNLLFKTLPVINFIEERGDIIDLSNLKRTSQMRTQTQFIVPNIKPSHIEGMLNHMIITEVIVHIGDNNFQIKKYDDWLRCKAIWSK